MINHLVPLCLLSEISRIWCLWVHALASYQLHLALFECIMACIDSQQPEAHFFPHVLNLINTKACSFAPKSHFDICRKSACKQKHKNFEINTFYYWSSRDKQTCSALTCGHPVEWKHKHDWLELEISTMMSPLQSWQWLGPGQVTGERSDDKFFKKGDTFIHVFIHTFIHSEFLRKKKNEGLF